MPRVTPTRQQVRDIAQELLQSGVVPSQSKIREIIFERHGTKASPNVVAEELEQFWKTQGDASKRVEEIAAPVQAQSSPPGDPYLERKLHFGTSLWEAALAAAREELLLLDPLERSRETARVAALRHSLEEKTQALTETAERLADVSSRLTDSKAVEQSLVHERELLKAEISALKSATEAAGRNAEDRLIEIKQLHAEQVEQLQAEKKREFDMWDGLRKHLMLETDRIRTEHGEKLRNLTEQLDRAHLIEQQMRMQASRQSEEIAQAKRRAENAERELARLRASKQ